MMQCRKRKANFTKQELEVLIANVQARKDILFTKRNTPVSNQAKQHAWDCIARKVNSVETIGSEHRTVNDVRRKWVCLLSETKKAEIQRRRRMALAGSLSSSSSAASSTIGLGGSGEYTPFLAENILNICKSIENGGREGMSSVGRPSTRLDVEDANDLSMSSSNTGGAFVSELNLIGHSLGNNNSNNTNNDNNGDDCANFLQVASVYSQNEHIDGVEVQLNDSPIGNINSPTMSNKTSNIIANIKSLSRQTANIRSSSDGCGNNRVGSDVTPTSIYPISNINNRDTLQHLPNMNSDLDIVHITPNINTNAYADSAVYLNEAEVSNINLQNPPARSLRKRRHSQSVGTNDQPGTEQLLSDDADGNMGDDETAAGMEANTSMEQIDWNVGSSFANSTYINSSGSEQDRKATPDHQPYHVTISGGDSDIEEEVRPQRRKFHKSDEDYTEKLYWVEKKRLKIEERRLAIEEERLAIERQRLELDRQRMKMSKEDIADMITAAVSSARPSESKRTLSPLNICTAADASTDEYDDDDKSQSAVIPPIKSVPSNQILPSEMLKMAADTFDLSEVLDEDSVGISY